MNEEPATSLPCVLASGWGYTDPKWFEVFRGSHVLRPRLAYPRGLPWRRVRLAQMKPLPQHRASNSKNDALLLIWNSTTAIARLESQKRLVDCMNIIQTETGRYPVIYSRAYWVNDHLDVNALPEKTDWWLANYLRSNPDPYFTPEMTPPPMLPNGVKNWLIHQTSKEQDGSKVRRG